MPNDIYQCNQCEKSFKSSQSLNSHMKSHSDKKAVYKKTLCPTCDTFITNQHFKNHLNKRKNCLYCNKLFCIKSGESKKIFCSRSCFASYNNKKRDYSNWVNQKNFNNIKIWINLKNKAKENNIITKCYFCKSEFIKFYSNVITKNKYTKNDYCSDECIKKSQKERGSNSFKELWKNNRKELLKRASINGRKASNNRRSKDEISLYQLCESHFQNISHNEPIANGWDADILLIDHQVAILWNGPWHYKEMELKNHSLKQVQNRDKIKIKEFENIGWSVLVYEDRYYTPESAFEDIKKWLRVWESNPFLLRMRQPT